MSLTEVLQQQLNQLKQQADKTDLKRPYGKPQNWFDSELFSCRSANLAEYVAEAQRNLKRLTTSTSLSALAKQRLVQRLSEQVNALTQAFRNIGLHQQSFSRRATQKVVENITASSQQLYQQLSDYQGFERRLLDMISLASRDNSAEQVQRTLALHQRLGRCRKAISAVEQQIQDYERQQMS
ncbi:primosomal replication protein PriC [Rheinheimera sp. MMS21-TC3]|uniref:primosomal replication protein PriC n=1 Tax=Rheinheimera sp. MMS21-TC3 TaxID=3072790 RepID=UPI0028C46808|nr:primosomal replication protein PriC [Rheinheimera sp. MMS21-TC3]WNO61975.1 primosomal replication protein PriC [Rheinheimera sp. MMS21-TC3]